MLHIMLALNIFQMLLLLYGKSDVTPFVEGAEFVVSSDGEPHPNILTRRVRFMPIEFTFACPLPSKMSVFYNIITPLQLTVWLAVVATLVLASLAGRALGTCGLLIVCLCFLSSLLIFYSNFAT